MVAVAGKVVLVTGGRRGLGSALVDEVLARGARKVYSTAREAYADDRAAVVTHATRGALRGIRLPRWPRWPPTSTS